jgi:ribonuclease-3
MEDLLVLEDRLGIPISYFALMGKALTHRSYLNEHPDITEDNERLEFLGDAVIDLIVADYLFSTFPKMDEGEMTSLRSALVRAETLAEFAQELGVDTVLRLGSGEVDNGGRTRIPTLCAAFEAVMGATYLDAGYHETQKFLIKVIKPKLSFVMENGLHKDARSEFQIWAQAKYGDTPKYDVVEVSGPDHDRRFMVQVSVKGAPWGKGSGRSKQVAAHEAASGAMQNIQDFENGTGSAPPSLEALETN